MKTKYEIGQDIKQMPQNIRLAGYLLLSAKMTELLSRLRLEHDKDTDWSVEDSQKYEDLCDEIDPWWYALSEEEKEFLNPIEIRTAILSNGENITNNPFLIESK